jgi:hypothetical protein
MAVGVSKAEATMVHAASRSFARGHGERTVVVLLPQRSHASFECRIQRSPHRVYRARRGPATWRVAGAAGRVWAGRPVMLRGEGELGRGDVGRQELEALLGGPPRRGRHDRGASSGRVGGRGIGRAQSGLRRSEGYGMPSRGSRRSEAAEHRSRRRGRRNVAERRVERGGQLVVCVACEQSSWRSDWPQGRSRRPQGARRGSRRPPALSAAAARKPQRPRAWTWPRTRAVQCSAVQQHARPSTRAASPGAPRSSETSTGRGCGFHPVLACTTPGAASLAR